MSQAYPSPVPRPSSICTGDRLQIRPQKGTTSKSFSRNGIGTTYK